MSRILREALFDSIISRLRKAGELQRAAKDLSLPLSVVDQWNHPEHETPRRPSIEVQLEIIYWAREKRTVEVEPSKLI